MSKSKTDWINQEIADLKAAGLFNTIRTIESPMDARVRIEGKELLNFCANNYLGLANHPRICQAAKDAIDANGVGPGAVRTIAGTMSLHIELEETAGSVQKGGSLHHIPEWFYRQPGHCAGYYRPGRHHLFR